MSEPIGRPSIGGDAGLMGRVRDNDQAALATLMERWELPLKAFIARIVLNTSEAEELAQETFVAVWQNRTRFRAGADFKPWVFTIALNLARKRLRWRRRRPSVSLDEWMETDSADPLAKPDPGAGAPRLERAEIAAAVRDAIAALPPDLREAIVLFEYENLSHAEIAGIVGATPKAVETRIYRAKEKLRTALSAWVR
jgi:RNA polymerase sigma-70 factor (ECF subfamily)